MAILSVVYTWFAIVTVLSLVFYKEHVSKDLQSTKVIRRVKVLSRILVCLLVGMTMIYLLMFSFSLFGRFVKGEPRVFLSGAGGLAFCGIIALQQWRSIRYFH